MSEIISTEIVGNVGLIAIDNPPVNAAGIAVRSGIFDAVTELEENGKVEVIAEMLCGEAECHGSQTGAAENVRLVRIVRLAKIVRLIRVVKLLTFFGPLRLFLYSILTTLKTLAWALVRLNPKRRFCQDHFDQARKGCWPEHKLSLSIQNYSLFLF